jgi:acyl-CoA thioester hydrolase
MAHVSAPLLVEPAWGDYNGHLNMAYYNVLFDRALDGAAERVGLGPAYAATGFSFFTAEIHVRYLEEVATGAFVTVTTRLLAADAKRLHWWQEMHGADGAPHATSEVLSLHVDLTLRKVAPFPEAIRRLAAALAAEEGAGPPPRGLGRVISVR